MQRSISIVTPWYGPTSELLPAYAAAVHGARVVAVDNATPPETAQALSATASADGWRYIRNEQNNGFAGGNNQGYAASDGEIVVFLNSDIVAPPEFLEAIAHDVRDGALYGPSLQHQLVAGQWLPYLEGWCIAATRATWIQISNEIDIAKGRIRLADDYGPWDHEHYPGPYWEDNDLCLRALQAGVSLVHTAWPIQHLGGRSAGPLTRHAHTFERNRATFGMRALDALNVLKAGPPTPARQRYYAELSRDSDIRHHLPLLFASARGNVVELGTRGGASTWALLAGVERRGGCVTSVDIDDCSGVAQGHPLWAFVRGSSIDPATPEITTDQPIDLLFVDTLHTYDHVAAEFAIWADRVRPGGRILVHDPETFPGVRRAVAEFCEARGWPVTWVLPCNGMAVVEVPE